MKKWIRRFVMTILGLVLGTGMYMICAERVLKIPFPCLLVSALLMLFQEVWNLL